MVTTTNVVEIITIVVSIISMLFSLSVVVILLLHYKTLVSGKLLIHNVLIIAICDTLVSFSYALGFHTQSHICALQGFISLNSERASWFWTDCLIMNIYGIVVHQKYIIKSKAVLHIIVWTITIVLAFIPYANGVTYGTAVTIGTYRCGYGISESSSINAYDNWNLFQYICCFSSLILIMIITIRIYIFTYYPSQDSLPSHNIGFFKTLLLYPIAMFICWFPSQFFFTLIISSTETTQADTIGNILHILAPLYGLFLSLIFYTKTDKARVEWINIFTRLRLIGQPNEVELRESSYTVSSDMPVCDVVENTLVVRILE